MNEKLFWILSAVLSICGLALTSCANTENGDSDAEAVEAQAVTEAETTDTYMAAVDRYMVNEIGKRYDSADYNIPVDMIVAVDGSKPDSVLVWGDFWIENYNLSGDTLLFASGGSYPGCMLVVKSGDTFSVANFDIVEDGSGNLASSKRIFGDMFGEFQKIQSNDELKKELRRKAILEYVNTNGIKATMYKDYGWPAVNLE